MSSIDLIPVRNALISVFDKSGLEPLVNALKSVGARVYSTGGTGDYLQKQFGLAIHRIEDVTQFPEMMDGRVKTLHPRIFGGILARRAQPKDLEEASQHQVPLFDLVVVNLYPFWDHRGETVDQQTSFIDIGGPSMVRASAKNHEAVTILSSPDDYGSFVEELGAHQGQTRRTFRFRMAGRAFERTAAYDAMIAKEWREPGTLPSTLSLSPQTTLRYGENPHQAAAWAGPDGQKWKLLQGKELSYNNLLDAEAAYRLAFDFEEPSVAIIKHNNPCGVAVGKGRLSELYRRALACDSKSAFGGIVATNRPVVGEAAKEMSQIFLEVVMAPHFTEEAREIFAAKKNLRLIEWESPRFSPVDVRGALGGWLVQTGDCTTVPDPLKNVTEKKVGDAELRDLKFAWVVCKHVRSNAIVVAKDGVTIGIGAGQMSRVDAVEIALKKNPVPADAVLASDAFFPFRDNIDMLKDTGVRAVIQPGGSQRDTEVIEACDQHGIAMVFTGERHFRH